MAFEFFESFALGDVFTPFESRIWLPKSPKPCHFALTRTSYVVCKIKHFIRLKLRKRRLFVFFNLLPLLWRRLLKFKFLAFFQTTSLIFYTKG